MKEATKKLKLFIQDKFSVGGYPTVYEEEFTDIFNRIIEIAYLEGINDGMGYSCGAIEFEVGDKVLHLFENKEGLQTIDERLKELTDDK